MDTEKNVLTRAQIEGDLDRSYRFIKTVTADSIIRAVLGDHGYTEEVHNEGTALFMYLFGEETPWFHRAPRALCAAREAVKALNEWDRKYYLMTRATLEHLHPEQAAYIFDGLRIGDDFGAAASIKAFLAKIVSLREGTDPAREGSRAEDRAAVLALEARNIVGLEIEARLERLITEATRIAPLPPEKDEQAIEEFYEMAWKLHGWIRDWRQMARAVIANRRDLIKLGVIRHRNRKVSEQPAGNRPADGGSPGSGSGGAQPPPAGAPCSCCGNVPGTGSAGSGGAAA